MGQGFGGEIVLYGAMLTVPTVVFYLFPPKTNLPVGYAASSSVFSAVRAQIVFPFAMAASAVLMST